MYTSMYIQIYNEVCIHTHTHTHTMEYYSAIKMNEITPFVAMWLDLEIIILSKVGQKEKNKQHMIALIYRIRCDPNEHINKAETDSQA